MGFYELFVKDKPGDLLFEMAGRIGWNGLCIVYDEGDKPMGAKEQGLEVSSGILIRPKARKDVGRLSGKHRNRFELLCAAGGNPELNREIVENPEIDMLVNHSPNGEQGINYVIAKLAKENNVMVCFDFRELVSSYKKTRSHIFSSMVEAAGLVRKYKTPFCVTSGAMSPWELRSPSDLLSFSRLLGLPDRLVKSAMSGRVLEENRKFLSGSLVCRGVERLPDKS